MGTLVSWPRYTRRAKSGRHLTEEAKEATQTFQRICYYDALPSCAFTFVCLTSTKREAAGHLMKHGDATFSTPSIIFMERQSTFF